MNTGAKSRVWADGIELNASSTLTAEDADIFVKDDLTLKGDKNNVTLKGSYYGYGNEGDSSALEQETPNKSSAVIINDRGSSLDLTGLDSLILAGRAYMRFDDTITNGQYVYPMGESLAVKDHSDDVFDTGDIHSPGMEWKYTGCRFQPGTLAR